MVKERNFVQLHDVARRLPDHFRGAAEDHHDLQTLKITAFFMF